LGKEAFIAKGESFLWSSDGKEKDFKKRKAWGELGDRKQTVR